jgi:pimeloyl-ACP methyl ester carboxylesterase
VAGRLVHACEQLQLTAPLLAVDGEPTGGYRALGGPGRLLLVLPGLVGPADALAALAAELGPTWRVCFITYPRVGSSAALLAWLEAVRQREGGGVAALCGGSFGGLVAQAWIRAHPESIGDVVLSGTGPPLPSRAVKNARALRWMRHVPMPVWRVALRSAVRLSTMAATDRRYWRRHYIGAIDALRWADLESRYRIAIGADEQGPPNAETHSRWRGRMLIIEGGRDRVARSSVRDALRATYPDAAFHRFDQAGHSPVLERPDDWLRAVAAFYRNG